MEFVYIGIALIVIAAVYKLASRILRRLTVFEFERGLRYERGRFAGVIAPGQYWYVPQFTTITKIDTRRSIENVPGQEVLSQDGVTIKVSLSAEYEIIDPALAMNRVSNFRESLYATLQVGLREIVSAKPVDELMESRESISTQLMASTAPKALEFGILLHSVKLRDLMLPSNLRQMFAQIVNARKEGLAALERARGETAALRSLANAAKMLDANPNLLHLRTLQVLSEKSGNSVILGIQHPASVVPIRTQPLPPNSPE
ncbi:MAG: slipin family protein [Candidatus Hydrogenedentes bacterium]|nr:slipin family protein [Candidatus Hydrogenedentota bacterium]